MPLGRKLSSRRKSSHGDSAQATAENAVTVNPISSDVQPEGVQMPRRHTSSARPVGESKLARQDSAERSANFVDIEEGDDFPDDFLDEDGEGLCGCCCAMICCCCPCGTKSGRKRYDEKLRKSKNGMDGGCFMSIFCCCGMRRGSGHAVGRDGHRDPFDGKDHFSCELFSEFLLIIFLVCVSVLVVLASVTVLFTIGLGIWNEGAAARDISQWLNVFQAIENPETAECPGLMELGNSSFRVVAVLLVLAQELLPIIPCCLCCKVFSKMAKKHFPGNFWAGFYYIFVGTYVSCIEISELGGGIVSYIGEDRARMLQSFAALGPFILCLCGVFNMTLGKLLGTPKRRIYNWRAKCA